MLKRNKYFSYAEEPQNENIVIEHTLKYSDVDEIKEAIKKYGIEKCIVVWQKYLLPDERLKKLNHFLAKFIFNISFENDMINQYIQQHGKKRIDRINEVFNG